MAAEGGLPGQPPASEVAVAVSDGKASAGAGDGGEVRTATPALSPGQGADGSPNSDKATKDGEVANEAPARTPAPALAVSSPTTLDVEVPTPRGVDQMSPDGNREYKIYKDFECCFCGEKKKFNGYLAFKKHVVSYCSAKPENQPYQQILEKFWHEQPAMDQAEMVSAFVMEDENDKDETDRDSDADDDGPRSDTVKHRAEAEATHNADSDDDRPTNNAALLKTPENLFDDVSNVDDEQTANKSTEPNRKRRTAARPSRYTAGIDDEDDHRASRGREVDKSTNDSQEYACAACGKSFKNAHSLKIHQSKMKHQDEPIVRASAGARGTKEKTQAAAVVVTNHSTTCDVCGVSVKSPAGLVTHKARWCKGAKSADTSVPNAQVVTTTTGKAPPKSASEAQTPLKELSVGAKSRKCLLREESGCEFKGISFDDLVRHMQVEHGVKVTRVGKQSTQGELPGNEPAVEEQSVRPQTETTILRIFHTQRSCAECSAKFSHKAGLIAHYKEAHNVWAVISAKEFKEAKALMNSSSAVSLPTSAPKPSSPKPNKLAHETRDTDRPSGKSKKTQLTCEYCQTYTGFWNAGFAAHVRSCKLKHPQTSPLEEEPLNVEVSFPGPPRTKEMDPGVRFCDECAAGDFKCKSWRQLCTHYKKEHNVELIEAAVVIEDRAALNQTDMEEVDETVVHDKGGHSVIKTTMEILTDQLQCPECDYKAKQHRGLCTHMRMKHKTIPIPVEPRHRRKRSRAASITAMDETHALVPVKRMTRELDDALPGNEIVEVENFQQLVKSFRELSAAHKELVRSHEELARSHEIATRANVQYEDRIAVLESGTSQGGDRRRGATREALALHAPDANTRVLYHNPDGLDCSPVVSFGRQVWLSGITCGGVVELTFTGQMRRVFDNLVRLLVMAGTDVAHLLQVKIHLKDIREMEAVCDIWDKFFSDAGIAREHRPCRHITQAVLSDAKLQVEMFAEAVLPGEGERAFPSGLPPKRIANA